VRINFVDVWLVSCQTWYPRVEDTTEILVYDLSYFQKPRGLESNPRSLLRILDKHPIHIILDSRIVYK
jgi:hypothetical protein